MSHDILQQLLEMISGKKLKLTINDNRSTMLSVRWEPDHTRVSLHRMFLEAPKNVMNALACYIKGEESTPGPLVKAFIESNLCNLDYSHQLKAGNLLVQGQVYNLKDIYDHLNHEYFDRELNLHITWFGKQGFKPRSRLTFGLYHDPLKLIKINRFLDSPKIPDFVVSYVVYHEMLHKVCPSYVDEKGVNHSHSDDFKRRELEFRDYILSQNWIKEHQESLFQVL